MKKILIHLSIGVSAFLAGSIAAVFLANVIGTELDEEIALSQFDPHFLPEIEIGVSLIHIEALERGDLEWIETFHCWRLGTYLQHLRPEEFDDDRREEANARMNEAMDTYRRLQAEGRCRNSPPDARSTPTQPTE